MGILDNLQKAARDAAPIAKELVSEAGRTAKAVGETIKEEQPVKKAAAGAGKAAISAGNAVIDIRREKRIEKDASVFADLKAKYPGGEILHVKPYYHYQLKKLQKLGVVLHPIEEMKLTYIVFDENKHPKFKIYGDYLRSRRVFSLHEWNGKRLGTVVEHNRIIRETSESLYIGKTLFAELTERYVVSDPRFVFEINLKTVKEKNTLFYDGRPYMDQASVRGFDLVAVADSSQEIPCLLFYIAISLIERPVSLYQGGE